MDERYACEICYRWHKSFVLATKVAPHHTGGDVDIPAHWIPVCDKHFANWFEDVDKSVRMPAFDLIRLVSKKRSSHAR